MNKLYAVSLLISCTCLLLVGCFAPKPDSLPTVQRDLDSALTIGFKHISTNRDESEAFWDNMSHFSNFRFKDANDVPFTISTGYLKNSDYPGYYKVTSCDYPVALLYAEKEGVEQAMQSNLPIEWDRSSNFSLHIRIGISSYQDLEQAAKMIENGLNAVTPFPIRHGEFFNGISGDSFQSVGIEVYSEEGQLTKEWSVGFFEFPYEGDEIASYSEILKGLQNNYVKEAKEGYVEVLSGEIPHEDRFAYPADQIRTVYVNGERLNPSEYTKNWTEHLYFNYIEEIGEYGAYHSTIFGGGPPPRYGFEHLVKVLGGEYEYIVSEKARIATWTIGSDTWRAEIPRSSVPEELTITKNSVPFHTLRDYRITMSDLELLFDVTAEVNQWDMAIYLTNDANISNP